MKGVPSHARHEARLNREYQENREPTPRQVEFARVLDQFLREQERQPKLNEIARILGVQYSTICSLRDAAVSSGIVGSSGFCSTRSLWVTAKGARAIAAAGDAPDERSE